MNRTERVQLVQSLISLRTQERRIKQKKAAVAADLLKGLVALKDEREEYDNGYVACVVRPNVSKRDEAAYAKLARKLGFATGQELDSAIDACNTTEPGTPYVKVTP